MDVNWVEESIGIDAFLRRAKRATNAHAQVLEQMVENGKMECVPENGGYVYNLTLIHGEAARKITTKAEKDAKGKRSKLDGGKGEGGKASQESKGRIGKQRG